MPEQFENNYTTQLNGTITSGSTTIVVDAAPVSMTGDFRIRIDDEIILVGAVSGLSFTGCTRGVEDTAAASHVDNATVTHILTAGGLTDAIAGVGVGSYGTIEFLIDGGGAVIATGIKGDLVVPFDCVITEATLLADQSGSIVIDIWKDSYANYPPVDGDSITASAPPTISSATKSTDATLTGWGTGKTLTRGQILRFNVDSCASIQRVTLSLTVTKS